VRFTLDVHMPRFTPVIRVKEKAIRAFTKDRWHPTSLADEASDAKTLLAISYLSAEALAKADPLFSYSVTSSSW